MEIIKEYDAVERINEAMKGMDLDALAKLLSQVCNVGKVVVVRDGPDDGVTVEDIIDQNIASSFVFEDGLEVGELDEDGKVLEWGDRYSVGEPCSEQDVGEFMTAIEAREMLPIFDENQGRVVAWVYANESQLIDGLNGKRN